MLIKKPITLCLLSVLFLNLFPTTAEASFFRNFFQRYRKPLPNIAEFVIDQNAKTGEFSTLLTAVIAVTQDPNLPDLVDALSNNHLTVFAPTDDSFADIGLDPNNIATALPLSDLSDILLYHVTAGKKRAIQLLLKRDIDMLNGDEAEVRFRFWPFGAYINDSKIIKANLKARNGFVHVIDEVLMPPPEIHSSGSLSLIGGNVPEPSSLLLCLSACGLLALRRKREQ